MAAKAIVVWNPSNQPVPNLSAILFVAGVPYFATLLTNSDGYFVWPTVPAGTGSILIWGAGVVNFEALVTLNDQNQTIRLGASPPQPGDIVLPAITPFRKPFVAAPRRYEGQMCGIRIAGLPPIPGGSADPELVVTWLAFLYDAPTRQEIYAGYKADGFTDFLVSWPDFQDAGGTPEGFKAHCQEVLDAGLRPCAMLSAKPASSADIRDINGTLANIMLVLPLLVGQVPRFCVGWELSLWLSPADVQFLIDALSPVWQKQPGTLGYVHFQSGYFAYQPDGEDTGAFWQAQVGNPPKINGILHQRDPNEDQGVQSEYQARIADCLVRFNGADNCPADSGDGNPFDFVALEITASEVFNQQMPQSAQNSWGDAAIATPPAGRVKVQGSGNGLTV